MPPSDALLQVLVRGELVAAALVFPVLFLVPAPYGRYERAGWGPSLPARLGWVLMESPAVLVTAWAFFAAGGARGGLAPWLFFALWQLHYVQRTAVYPLLMRATAHRKPWLTVLLALGFNVCNALCNGTAIARADGGALFAPGLPLVATLAGVALFLAGFAVNVHADHVLRTLRKPGETGYKIPEGGAFALVSAANYFGELLEWAGFALALRSPAALAFAAFSFANLVPRGWAHHQWYRRTFPSYPPKRRAVLPFLFALGS